MILKLQFNNLNFDELYKLIFFLTSFDPFPWSLLILCDLCIAENDLIQQIGKSQIYSVEKNIFFCMKITIQYLYQRFENFQ